MKVFDWSPVTLPMECDTPALWWFPSTFHVCFNGAVCFHAYLAPNEGPLAAFTYVLYEPITKERLRAFYKVQARA